LAQAKTANRFLFPFSHLVVGFYAGGVNNENFRSKSTYPPEKDIFLNLQKTKPFDIGGL
jgi:hypothetical protein